MSPYYELRIYECLEGRLPEMHERMKFVLPAILRKHGLPIPVACWDLHGGGSNGALVYLLPFTDLDHRLAAFARLYADPEWHVALPQAETAIEDGLLTHDRHEITFARLDPSDPAQVGQRFVSANLPALRTTGARLIGAFEMIFGPGLPCVVLFTVQPDQPEESAPAQHWHPRSVRGLDVYPVMPAAYCTARPLFAEFDWPAALQEPVSVR